MVTTIDPHTFQTFKHNTVEGRKFLKRVIRENENLDYSEQWSVRANPGTDWRLEFRRVFKEELGDPERIVTLMSDVTVWVYRPETRQSFADSEPVVICGCRYISIHAIRDVAVLCSLMCHDDFRIYAESSSGSTSSSKFGISTYYLEAQTKQLHGKVRIGNETMAVNGRRVISGSIEIE